MQRFLSSMAGLAAVLLAASPSLATQTVTDCNFTCTSDCELAGDIDCADSDSGIALTNGADFDFKGHAIICTATVSESNVDGECIETAITATDAGSLIHDTGATKGGIVGLFFKGVHCQNKASTEVNGIVIDGVDSTAVTNCAVIDGNNIIGTRNSDYPGDPAISTSGIGNSGDLIRNNTISEFANGIKASGTKPITITGNVLAVKYQANSGVGGTAIGVNLNSSTSSSVDHNSIVGRIGTPIVGNTTATFDDNHCDVDSANCAACISSGYCDTPAVEYCRASRAVFKPSHIGSVNQFSSRTPNVSSSQRWLLLADYPEANAGTPLSYILDPDSGTKTDLYTTNPVSDDSGGVYALCTLRAHMVGVGSPSQTTATYLVVKSGTESDGTQINVAGGDIAEYTRPMALNPVVSGLWTFEDAQNMEIGVKNVNGANGGVIVVDLQFDCD